MSLGIRDTGLRELMDEPDCDPERLAATLRRFAVVNRLVSGWGGVYRSRLRPYLAGLGRPARVLDLGSGAGDVLMRLATLADRDGLDVDWLGVDPDPRAHAVAVRCRARRLRFRCADAAALRAEGLTFDAVLSNHVLHHLSAAELRAFADDALDLSAGPVLHSDIERSRLAYGLYAIGITPFAPGTFLRTDGLRSIRRSFRADELATELNAPGAIEWTVERPTAFRLLAVGRGRATQGGGGA